MHCFTSCGPWATRLGKSLKIRQRDFLCGIEVGKDLVARAQRREPSEFAPTGEHAAWRMRAKLVWIRHLSENGKSNLRAEYADC